MSGVSTTSIFYRTLIRQSCNFWDEFKYAIFATKTDPVGIVLIQHPQGFEKGSTVIGWVASEAPKGVLLVSNAQ
jgi:hypothetical protein